MKNMKIKKNRSKTIVKIDLISSNITPDNKKRVIEIGGPKGLEPTRFGDWEKNGRCSDF